MNLPSWTYGHMTGGKYVIGKAMYFNVQRGTTSTVMTGRMFYYTGGIICAFQMRSCRLFEPLRMEYHQFIKNLTLDVTNGNYLHYWTWHEQSITCCTSNAHYYQKFIINLIWIALAFRSHEIFNFIQYFNQIHFNTIFSGLKLFIITWPKFNEVEKTCPKLHWMQGDSCLEYAKIMKKFGMCGFL